MKTDTLSNAVSPRTKTFLTVPEAAELAGFSTRHFRRIIKHAHIPIMQIRQKFFILDRDFQNWKSQGKAIPAVQVVIDTTVALIQEPAEMKMNTDVNPIHAQDAAPNWNLLLYVAGLNPGSAAALCNLQRICDRHLAGRYDIKVIDLMENPSMARDEQIVAVPTVVRKSPGTIRSVIGDLSNTERVVAGLQIPRNEPL